MKTNIKKREDISWKRISRDPLIDWIFMLLVGLAIITVMVAIGIFAYVDVGQASSSVSDLTASSRPLPIIDAVELKRVADKLDSSL